MLKPKSNFIVVYSTERVVGEKEIWRRILLNKYYYCGAIRKYQQVEQTVPQEYPK